MGQHSDRVREALLDAAEELFATNGIDAVSNRRIAEHAGAANHSVIAYHFGGRDELIRALILRHLDDMEARQRRLLAELGPDPSVSDVVRCRLLPYVEILDSLPTPSWRAQFLAQASSTPSTSAIAQEVVVESEIVREASPLFDRLADVPARVLRERSAILGHLVLGVCAEYEAQMNAGTAEGDWISVGYFLIDAAAGMLAAPVTHPAGPVTASAAGLI